MKENRTHLWGHGFALLFTGALLLVGRGFFALYPLRSAGILAFFAAIYLATAVIRQRPMTLYPGTLLLVLAYDLLAHGLGAAAIHLPLLTAPLAFIFYLLARYFHQRGQAYLSDGLNGSTVLLAAGLAVAILTSTPQYARSAPRQAFLTLLILALYFLLRFVVEKTSWHLWAFTALAVPALLFLLHSHPAAALYLASAVMLLVAVRNLARRQIGWESGLLAFAAVYLAAAGYLGWAESLIPLGYVACSLALVGLGLGLSRRLQEIVPFLAAGFVLTVVPVALTHPWDDQASLFIFLALVFFLYILSGSVLLGRERTMPGLMVGHTHVAFGEVVALTALAYTAARGFPLSYQNAVAALMMAAVAALAGLRVRPMLLKSRRAAFYLAGLFLTLAFLTALLQADPFQGVTADLSLAVPLLLALYILGEWSRGKVGQPGYQTLLEVPALTTALVGAVHVLRLPPEIMPALLLPALLAVPGILYSFRLKEVTPLFSSVVAAATALVALLTIDGVPRSASALVFLIAGVAMAAWSLYLIRRESHWSPLALFSLGVSAVASVGLSHPWAAGELFVAVPWPVLCLVLAALVDGVQHRTVRIALEVASYALMLFTLAMATGRGLLGAVPLILTLYALTFLFAWVRRKVGLYLYPACIFVVLAVLLTLVLARVAGLHVLLAAPLTAVFYAAGVYLKKKGRPDSGMALCVGGHLNALIGAVVFLVASQRWMTDLGLVGIALYLFVYLFMAYGLGERPFLAGAGLAFSLLFLTALSSLPFVDPPDVLAYFAVVLPILFAWGWVLRSRGDPVGGWGVLASALVVALLSSAATIWMESINSTSTWITLLVVAALWLAFLVVTRHEVFVYLVTASLALLSYAFLRTVENRFATHMFVFLVYGCLLLGLVFLYDIIKNHTRLRSPVHFGKRELWTDKVVYASPVVLLALVALGGFTVESTSNPVFCNACHQMSVYYTTWERSSHGEAGVTCEACHYEPNIRSYLRTKAVGLSELVKTATGTEGFMPIAVVSDQSCTRGGCHTAQALRTEPVVMEEGRVSFSHARHLGTTLRTVQIQCTVCHTNLSAEAHFSVNVDACLLCHFKGRGSRSSYIGLCPDCHAPIWLAPTRQGFAHRALLEMKEVVGCPVCHQDRTTGEGEIDPERCSFCHIERPEELLEGNVLRTHQTHIAGKGIGCLQCHERIRHQMPLAGTG